MAYRESAAAAARVLEVRPDASGPMRVAVAVVMAVVFVGVGVAMLGGAVAATQDTMLRVWLAVFGVPFSAVGAVVLYSMWTSETTMLRLSLDEQALLLQWRRRGRALRTEQVGREDLKELMISYRRDDHDVAWYQLILKTAHGDIPVNRTASARISPLARQRRVLEKFLGLPPSPQY